MGSDYADNSRPGPRFKLTILQEDTAQANPPLAIAVGVDPAHGTGEGPPVVLFQASNQLIGARPWDATHRQPWGETSVERPARRARSWSDRGAR